MPMDRRLGKNKAAVHRVPVRNACLISNRHREPVGSKGRSSSENRHREPLICPTRKLRHKRMEVIPPFDDTILTIAVSCRTSSHFNRKRTEQV